ncbi:T9SS type A sorting domain-containing protein [Psychroserpens sp.]|uniref:T9SS type A sorting domain-containing protein n=1 Tax=Psychroserpens sp. TaxID=2020870 RepID=UPI001B095588|nr:T9SS type A sorting domain-containing protein [Psychroserpens sp.]MBO6605226.1 T9SS type A sorting domain-containing protein [Psychroserpens sp.]MBO6630140.1 T9SS type A sorting domain-containing protein [Psychroserpens sp.]MBO6653965.1 T9SS type A sorting domain-containing protein [Psychroserpens sp.]MBO6682286.1 T9SS type A sorting domain-containing protein [Psychroserpens sp.]MBO6748600.1 T9SS type A sorting domain-containing protein [Psychroserpens sp.]
MKKTTLSTILLILTIVFGSNDSVYSQEMLYEVPMPQQVQASSQIVEGKVISKASLWDNAQMNIYTVNTVEVYRVFKGQSFVDTIEVITPGGTVNDNYEVVTPSLGLNVGDVGVFMLQGNNTSISNGTTRPKYKAYSSIQGFYKYDLASNTAYNPYYTVENITGSFYNLLQSLTNGAPVVIEDFDADEVFANRNVGGSASITFFTPTTVNGGVRDLLTINGFGFGVSGTVGFRDANFGGSQFYDALSSQIVSWTDTQIVVEVPSRAGTGNIRVQPVTGGTATSIDDLEVFYSQINPSNGSFDFPSQHVDDNGVGGYTWQMHTDFNNNAAANASFLRAFDTWVCTTGVNWEIGSVTTVDVIAADGINVIRFDNGGEMPAGTLGINTSRFGACGSASPGGLDVFVNELDIVFNDTTNWEFGPSPASGGQIDFETVAVHELGHAHQLAHIIDPGAIMHFAIGPNQTNRVLSDSDLGGANDVMVRNINNAVCGENVMTYSACSSLSVDDNFLAENISIFPNPAKDVLNILSNTSIQLENATIYDVRGRKVLSQDLSTSTFNTINVEQLNSGVYFIQLNAENATTSKKFIVN